LLSYSQPLKKFVDDAESGVVFISFGSMLNVSSMQQDQFEVMLEAIAYFPQRFIWRWDDISIDKPLFKNLPKRLHDVLTDEKKLYKATWLPQVDILGKLIFVITIRKLILV
jgi:hypothetical protein